MADHTGKQGTCIGQVFYGALSTRMDCKERFMHMGTSKSEGQSKHTHFMTVLGTSLYEPVNYYFTGNSATDHGIEEQNTPEPFVQTALLRKFGKELADSDALITIFVTDKARKANWEDRSYTSCDTDIMKRAHWADTLCHPAGDIRQGLASQIKSIFPESGNRDYPKTEAVSIPEGRNEKEILDILWLM